MTNSLHDELISDLSEHKPELAEISNKSAYPCIKCFYEYGSGWVAEYEYKDSRNNNIKAREVEEMDYELSPLENAQIVAIKLACLNIKHNMRVISSGFDADNYFIICG